MTKLIILQLLLWTFNLICTNQINETTNVDSSRIINGIDVPLGKYPFVVSVMKGASGQFSHTCTGSVLNSKTILTAAHCLVKDNADKYRVMVGQINFQNVSSSYIFEVQSIKYHNRFIPNEATAGYDIGIMILKKEISFKQLKNVNIVCLPSIASVPESSKCVAIGFGRTEISNAPIKLRSAILLIKSKRICKSKYQINPYKIICAGFINGAAACFGDSGGPLVCPLKANPKKILQFGITSFGPNPCNKSYSYFTNVGPYVQWLNVNVKQIK